MGHAIRAAKLRDIEATTRMSVNTSCSILHFSEHDIINNAGNLGTSLSSNGKEIEKSVNDLLDLEAERALEMSHNIVSMKPMNDVETYNLGITALESLCGDLIPTSGAEAEVDEMGSEGYVAPLPRECTTQTVPGHMDVKGVQDKPKHSWKRKVYPASAVRRSARFKFMKKSHDDKWKESFRIAEVQ